MPLICGVAYAVVGRCNPASVDGEAGRYMAHAATNEVDQRGRAVVGEVPGLLVFLATAKKRVVAEGKGPVPILTTATKDRGLRLRTK